MQDGEWIRSRSHRFVLEYNLIEIHSQFRLDFTPSGLRKNAACAMPRRGVPGVQSQTHLNSNLKKGREALPAHNTRIDRGAHGRSARVSPRRA